MALRVSYVGELGWELHIPTEVNNFCQFKRTLTILPYPPHPLQYGLHVFDQLTEVGEKFDLKFAGSYAMDNLRLEKGYRHWGHELDSETSPLEARLMHAVDLQKVE